MFTLRNLQDADRIKALADGGAQHAVLLGAGFISIELAESLLRRDVGVTLVEKADQILPPFDKEMTAPMAERLVAEGASLLLNQSAEAIEQGEGGLTVRLSSGQACRPRW